jgi:hypothetical protein
MFLRSYFDNTSLLGTEDYTKAFMNVFSDSFCYMEIIIQTSRGTNAIYYCTSVLSTWLYLQAEFCLLAWKNRNMMPCVLRMKNLLVIRGLSKKYPTLFFPAVSNGERVGKLSAMVERIFMRMRDSLLPLNTAGCVCHFQMAKWCNTCSSHSHFAQDDRLLGAAILKQVLSEPWGYPSRK